MRLTCARAMSARERRSFERDWVRQPRLNRGELVCSPSAMLDAPLLWWPNLPCDTGDVGTEFRRGSGEPVRGICGDGSPNSGLCRASPGWGMYSYESGGVGVRLESTGTSGTL